MGKLGSTTHWVGHRHRCGHINRLGDSLGALLHGPDDCEAGHTAVSCSSLEAKGICVVQGLGQVGACTSNHGGLTLAGAELDAAHTAADRQAGRQTDRQTDRQADRQ